jgi:hypothetical protein
MNTKNQQTQRCTLTPVPDGFTTGVGSNNQQYLVPQYMVPALDQAFSAYQSKADLGVLNARPRVSVFTCGAVGPTQYCLFSLFSILVFPNWK